MPWVAACFELLATPLLGYCLAVRKLALQAGVLQEERNDPTGQQTSNEETPLNADIMVPNAEEQRQGKVSLVVTYPRDDDVCLYNSYFLSYF